SSDLDSYRVAGAILFDASLFKLLRAAFAALFLSKFSINPSLRKNLPTAVHKPILEWRAGIESQAHL
ncbi:MAG: hypothetical protein RLN85_19105, partial [Pseudomonadales bacterium]